MTTLKIGVSKDYSNQSLTGVDLIDFTNALGTTVTATFKGSQLDGGMSIDGSGGTNIIVVNGASDHTIFDQPFTNWGADDRVVLNGNGLNNTLRSMGGNDRFFGFAGDDTFDVNLGFVQVSAGEGADLIKLSGAGATIAAGAVVNGGSGFDTLEASPGLVNLRELDINSVEQVRFTAAVGEFNIISVDGTDVGSGHIRRVEGSSADDTFSILTHGGDFSDLQFASWSDRDSVTIYGYSGDETIIGTNKADFFLTIGGNDILEGGNGADTFQAGNGNDVMVGQAGGDFLSGGGGANTFVYEKVSDSRGTQVDIIIDFNRSTDKIDLTAIDAIAGTTVNDDFTFINGSAFSGAAGELRYKGNADGVRLLGDIDGDKTADFAIQVNDVVKLGPLDLVL